MKNNDESSLSQLDSSSVGVSRLKEKRSRLIYQLGKLVDDLSRAEAIQFLFVSEHQDAEKEIQHLLGKMNDLDESIRLQGGSPDDESDDESEFAPEEREETQEEAEEVGDKCDSASEEPKVKEAIAEEDASEEFVLPDVPSETAVSDEPEPADVEEVVPAAAKPEPSLCKFIPREKELVHEKPSQAVSQNEPEDLDYQALAGTLHFDVPAEAQRFEQLLAFMNSSAESERLRSFNRIAVSFERGYVFALAQLAIDDPSVAVRRAVLKILPRLKKDQASEIYQVALYDPESNIRIAAIKGLSMLLFEKSLSAIEPLLADSDPEVRSSAVSYLGLYGGDAGISAAVTARHDPNPLVRKSVASILGIVRPPRAVMLLEEMLSDDVPEVEVTVEAALAKVLKNKHAKRF